ncbi:unnamed protein product [Bemisia tabaci]|uniref:Zinc finger protein chinmo n=1 Tax=Bemisia tabaci TaxID=7038 RepID=A0A9N9ZZE6_BEMTA|nr:PREDICTED: modifier of mdg4 isoform X2 [Bemisia tabaci]CAH0382555.1 unnamed protein product [Bemisia tabaci]
MDPQQQFCLKWNSFGSNLVTAFDSLFKSESLTDVTLFCEGVTFKAHRLILAACSKHFQDIFESATLTQGVNVVVILDGTSSSNMSALLEFMYKGEVHVSQEKLSSFLKAAEALQVKGLSIEHEKLAAAQQEHHDNVVEETRREELESPSGRSGKLSDRKQSNVSTSKPDESTSNDSTMQPPPTSSYSPVFTPYIHHYRTPAFEQRVPPSSQQTTPTSMATGYDNLPRKRYYGRSPSDPMRDSSIRPSVLRDATKPERESPISVSQFPGQPGSPHYFYEASDSVGSFDRPAAVDTNRPTPSPGNPHWPPPMNPNCAEDLRVKSEVPSGGESSENGSRGREKEKESSPAAGSQMVLWNSVQTTKELVLYKQPVLQKSTTSTSTPDGKKLQCPYCERLYGYETNLRAHIRQRHQGIRVPCPFCTRTFTRNNTVRRHIAREHKTELSLKAFQQTQNQNHNQ